MIRIFLIVLLYSIISFSQKSDKELNYMYHFPNNQVSLLLTGHKEDEASRYIYATEFFVIDNTSSDTLLFFNAPQYCIIDKNNIDTLSIIEARNLPIGFSYCCTSLNYLKFYFTLNSFNKIEIDTLWLLLVPKLTSPDKEKVTKEYEEVYEKNKDGVGFIPPELTYYLLYMALNDDAWAKEKLFNMKMELKLDGWIAEINEDAINMYKTYYRLK